LRSKASERNHLIPSKTKKGATKGRSTL
jgi:hypothetical protein